MARASISDVAQLAGVSESTVSRALNGKGRVSDHTRQRVTAAADELNFTLSRNASTLATGKTMRVLFLVSGELKAWFNASALQGVYGVLAPEGYDVMPSFIMNGAELQRYFAELPKNRSRCHHRLIVPVQPRVARSAGREWNACHRPQFAIHTGFRRINHHR